MRSVTIDGKIDGRVDRVSGKIEQKLKIGGQIIFIEIENKVEEGIPEEIESEIICDTGAPWSKNLDGDPHPMLSEFVYGINRTA